ncbi:magnesium transporter [Brevirhabdus sp.]|uniref:magnesium transporter n=1 Tax=Brevirhabdus sp. TaxID=2004514 RepID=UPI0040581EC6
MAEQETAVDTAEEDDTELDRHRGDAILEAVEIADRDALTALLEPLHAADIADFLEQISAGERRRLITLWGDGIDGEILSELDENLREEVIATLDPSVLAEAVRELESDDVVDLIEDLDQPQRFAILEALEKADRVAVEQSLSFPEESAGRLMQPNVVRAPEHWTVGDAIDYLRAARELPDQFYHIILVDPRMHPTGYVTLGKLLGTARRTRLLEITEESFRTISVTTPEEEVAYMFNQYHLISAPVVDDEDRLVGVITIDDAMLVLDAEAGEDMMLLAGVGDESVSDRTLKIARQRFPWLMVNLMTAILASLVIAQFEAAITQIVALAVLMPIVASMGGNAGTQSLTVAVRALATRDLTGSNALRVVRREATAGLLNGAAFAGIMAVVGIVWFGLPMLGVVIAAAMVLNLVVAALAGVLIPLGLEKIGVDPALASGAFVTTVTDVTGFFAFLGLAVMLLL